MSHSQKLVVLESFLADIEFSRTRLISLALADSMMLIQMAVALAPAWLVLKSQFFRPITKLFILRSAALLLKLA